MAEAHAQPDCVFCGYRDAPVHLARPEFGVRRCPHCAVLWTDPLTRADARETTAALTLDPPDAGELRRLLRHVEPTSHPRLVEVGSRRGDFLHAARAAGFHVEGLVADAAERARVDRWLPGITRVGTLDDRFPDASVDVVAALDGVDRLARPDRLLAELTRVLRPGGVWMVETPALESVEHHAGFLRARARPEHDVGMGPGARMFKFGRRSWATILRDRQFEVLAVEARPASLRERLGHAGGPLERVGILGVGALGRLTGWSSRVLVVARWPGTARARGRA